jgi:hypothetical protein
VSKYYTPKNGRLWRRAKRSDRSEGAASAVRHIDPATVAVPEFKASVRPMAKWKSDAIAMPGDGEPCPRCGVMMRAFRHAAIGKQQQRAPFYYLRWFRCYNVACRTTIVQRDADRQWNVSGEQREQLEQWLQQNAKRQAAMQRRSS